MKIGDCKHPTVSEVLARLESSGPRLSLNEKYVLRSAIIRANNQEAENARRNKAAWTLKPQP